VAAIAETTAGDNFLNGISVYSGFATLSSVLANANTANGPVETTGLSIDAAGAALITNCVFVGSSEDRGVTNQGFLYTRQNNWIGLLNGNAPIPELPQ
jgi:hypothetical protein